MDVLCHFHTYEKKFKGIFVLRLIYNLWFLEMTVTH